MTYMNAHALFVGANVSASYHQAILLPDDKVEALRSADKQLRAAMRSAAELVVKQGNVMAYASDAFRNQKQTAPSLELKFLLQGGMAYKTAIHPAILPPQQCDRDTGVYVKTSYLDHDSPGIASKKYFELVERAIKPLCDARGWKLIDNDSCVRVELSPELHIDYPLYAIPDEEFVALAMAFADTTGIALNSAMDNISEYFHRFPHLRIPTDRVMLAHREFGWIQSDPRALHDWFEDHFSRFVGLRRQCRYLKGWRDFTFDTGGPSSILLMVCAANAYRSGIVDVKDNRDDEAFLSIAKALPEMLRGDVLNPVLEEHSVLNAWDDVERHRIVSEVEQLVQHVDTALNGHFHSSITVERLRNALGGRVPNRPDLVKAHMSVPGEVSTPAKIAPVSALPQVRRTVSG